MCKKYVAEKTKHFLGKFQQQKHGGDSNILRSKIKQLKL